MVFRSAAVFQEVRVNFCNQIKVLKCLFVSVKSLKVFVCFSLCVQMLNDSECFRVIDIYSFRRCIKELVYVVLVELVFHSRSGSGPGF